MQGDPPCRIAFNDGLQTSRCVICLRIGGADLVETCRHRPVAPHETAPRETQAPLPSTGETVAETAVDTSSAAVERIAALCKRKAAPTPRLKAAATLRALAAERDAAVAKVEAQERWVAEYSERTHRENIRKDAAVADAEYALGRARERASAALSRAEAAEARASEHGAYRTAASAFLASKKLLPEFDAWCEARGMPADAVGALVEVARAARIVLAEPGEDALNMSALDAALDALPPGILDQPSEG